MTLTPPSDDNFDWSSLEEIFEGVDTEDVVAVSSLGTEDLLNQYHKVTNELGALQETRHPRTVQGRTLHSLRVALTVELHKRQIL